MRNLLFTIRFNGAGFHGWQVQENAVTVQQTVQDAIESIIGARENIVGCSRTDSGVHANMYCFNMRTDSALECESFINAMNAKLPESIAVTGCREVPFEFHARYDCLAKQYIYRIYNSPVPDPFEVDRSLRYKYPLDEKFLDGQAKDYIGTYDYRAFSSAGSSVKDTVRTITHASVTREGDIVTFAVQGSGFLYNMVRIMTGTLLYISQGKIPPGTIKDIIASGERDRAGITAPPEGLYLNNVIYSV
ncbi:MAG: tRNA pseudouridine(38-40) synthase TruA [Clostridiales bacterium]|nr:tRNA pseudouridine(38-40) synthase TruA [Clostridiales bacterium]